MPTKKRKAKSDRREIAFSVEGIPLPKGSMRAYVRGKRAVLVPDNKRLYPWVNRVRDHAEILMGEDEPFDDAVEMIIDFYLPRPKTVKRAYPTPKPDIDKLQRSVLDALTGVLYFDDSQVVRVTAQKHYADARPAGVDVIVCNIM